MSGISLDQLGVLRAVAKHRSIGAAARALYLSQPTLSHHLAAFEAIVGGRVLERSPRGSQLTVLGEIALVHAEAILDRTDAAERELRDAALAGTTAVAVGSFPSAGAALLVPSLARLANTRVRYPITIGEQPELVRQLRDRSLHVALLASEPEVYPSISDDVSVQPVLDDPLVVLLPADHAATRRRRVRLDDLATDPWIVAAADDDPPRDSLFRAFGRLGISPRVAHRVDDYAVTEALVSAGLGVSLIPSIAIAQLAGHAVMRPLIDPPFLRRIYVAWHSRPKSAAIERVVDEIQMTSASTDPPETRPGQPRAQSGAATRRQRRTS